MARRKTPSPSETKEKVGGVNPLTLLQSFIMAGLDPSFDFKWKEPGKKKGENLPPQRKKKRRMISRPNDAMIKLHKIFRAHLVEALKEVRLLSNGLDSYSLWRLPSATGCVKGSNHFKNAIVHKGRRWSYITDFRNAYPTVDLERLTTLLVFIFNYKDHFDSYSMKSFPHNELAQYAMKTDPLYNPMLSFVRIVFGGLHGEGLAVGGTLSPYLLNLYCEVYLDNRVRALCGKTKDREHPEKEIVYTRYVDDLVFSSNTFIHPDTRKEIRRFIVEAGFQVNHMKSRFEDVLKGTVFITKVGRDVRGDENVLRFPQKKRRRIEGIMKSYLVTPFQNDDPETIRSMISEFLYYYKQVKPTKSDVRTMRLCKQFMEASKGYIRPIPKKEKSIYQPRT